MKLWQSALLRVILFLTGLAVSFFPRKLELILGPKLGLLLIRIGKKRRQVAFENISRCFPDLTQEKQIELLRENYKHYGILILELLHMFSPIPGHYCRYAKKNIHLEGAENWNKAFAKQKGVLFSGTHLANWELMTAAGALNGFQITMVTKHLKPEWLHKKMEKSRASVGIHAVYEPNTLSGILRALKRKEAVGFVLDQYAGAPIGIPVPFFGVRVGTLAAVGKLMVRTGAQVLPVRTYRDQKGIVHTCIEPALEADRIELTEKSLEESITADLAQKVEVWVRQHPSQWLWIHRRFKNVVWPQNFA